jgi:hypothetical protein
MSAHCHLRITHQWQDDRVISVPVQPSIWVWFIDHVGWVTAPFSSVFSGPFQTRTFETVSATCGVVRYLPCRLVKHFAV